MKKPNYTIEDRTQLILAGQTRTIDRRDDGNYDVFNEAAGTHCVWNLNEVLNFLRMPGVAAKELIQSVSSAAARLREGHRFHKENLSPAARDQIDFRKALILGLMRSKPKAQKFIKQLWTKRKSYFGLSSLPRRSTLPSR